MVLIVLLYTAYIVTTVDSSDIKAPTFSEGLRPWVHLTHSEDVVLSLIVVLTLVSMPVRYSMVKPVD